MVLPNPTAEWIRELENIFFRFVWDRGRDKIKRSVMYGRYEDGGLRLPHIPTFIHSLKLIWIKKLLDPLDFSQWKILFLDMHESIYQGNIWNFNNKQLKWLAVEYFSNDFWYDVILSWSLCPDVTPTCAENFLSTCLWYNPDIQVGRKPIYYKKMFEAGIEYVNDLIDQNGNFYEYDQFIRETGLITINYLQYYGIISPIPDNWKKIIKDYGKKRNQIMHSEKLNILEKCWKPSRKF